MVHLGGFICSILHYIPQRLHDLLKEPKHSRAGTLRMRGDGMNHDFQIRP